MLFVRSRRPLATSSTAVLDFLAPSYTSRTSFSTSSSPHDDTSSPTPSSSKSRRRASLTRDGVDMIELRMKAARLLRQAESREQQEQNVIKKAERLASKPVEENAAAGSIRPTTSTKRPPRRKPLHTRHPSPSTTTSALDLLSRIRSTPDAPLPGDAPKDARASTVHQHNQAILNIANGISKQHRDFDAAFTQGWLPIRDAGAAARPPPQDLALVLETAAEEMAKGAETSRAEWKDVKELVLWLAGESDMPGVARWCWKALEQGEEGAKRVVEVWEGIVKGEHSALRRGPKALNRSFERPLAPSSSIPPPRNAPAAVFAAYLAARSIVHSQLDPTTRPTFSDILPTLLLSAPSLKRVKSDDNFASAVKTSLANVTTLPDRTTSISLAVSWIRQVALAQQWFHDQTTPGISIAKTARLQLRTSQHDVAWRTWLAIREGVENEDVKWIETSRWEASAGQRWMSAEEKWQEEHKQEVAAVREGEEESTSTPDATSTSPSETLSPSPPSSTTAAAVASTSSSPRTAYLTQALLAPFLAGFTRVKLFDQANEIWTWLPSLSPPLSPGIVTWTALLHGYAIRGDSIATEAVFSDIINAGIEPDVWAWMERVSAAFEAKEPDQAMKLAELMSNDKKLRSQLEEGRFPPVVYDRIMLGLLGNGRVEEAQDVLSKMEGEGVPTTIHSINNFLRYHTRGGPRRTKPDLSAVVRCLRLVAEHNLEADVYTFTMVLQALLATGQTDAITKLVQIMESTGVQPTPTTYGAIIDHLAGSGQVDQLRAAVDLIDEMERKGIKTNEIVYTSVIQGFLRAIGTTPLSTDVESDETRPHPYLVVALSLKQRMEKRGINLNRVGYNSIISASLSLHSDWGTRLALETFREMKNRPGVFASDGSGKVEMGGGGKSVTKNDTWYILLNGFAQMGDWSKARAILGEMERSGFRVQSKMMNRLVDTVNRGGWSTM